VRRSVVVSTREGSRRAERLSGVQTIAAPAPRADVEASVIADAKRGDQQAFAALVRHYDRGLRAVAFRLLGDRDRMDDALQEAYVKAYRALPKFRGEAGLGTWLYRITYNVCIDELRRPHAAGDVALDDAAGARSLESDPADLVGERSLLASALAALPAEDRAAVLLVDAEGFDYASAARILGVPAGTVASRLNRARATLRRALAGVPEGVVD
jgi:RNA polymerase sigma-70 factor (ECF subfamily)